MKNIFWTLVITFSLQNYVYAQSFSESQSRTGETQNVEMPIMDTINNSRKVDKTNNIVTLKNTQEKTPKKKQLLQKVQNIKEATRIKKYLKTSKADSKPLKSQKRADTIDTLNTMGWISLGLAFFFLVRLPLQTLWLFSIGLAITLIGLFILILNSNGGWDALMVVLLSLIFILIPGLVVMFLGLFSYLALVWHAAVLFNIIGFSLLGVALISLLIANLL